MNARQYLESLLAWDGVQRLEAHLNAAKKDVLAAEVFLPVPLGTDISMFRTALVRPPFQRQARLLLVDVSRLPAP
jgi:hypothetical protein